MLSLQKHQRQHLAAAAGVAYRLASAQWRNRRKYQNFLSISENSAKISYR
jgi:hypothetical protein